MKRAEPVDVGANQPAGAANPTGLQARSGHLNTRTVSSRSLDHGRSGRKSRISFYHRLKSLTPEDQALFLMYGKDGPGTPAQQLAAQIRTLKNFLARFPHLESDRKS